MKMVYDESYGELSYAQRAVYRKYNVSPSDHEDLVDVFGASNRAEIIAAVKKYSRDGMFSWYDMRQGESR